MIPSVIPEVAYSMEFLLFFDKSGRINHPQHIRTPTLAEQHWNCPKSFFLWGEGVRPNHLPDNTKEWETLDL